MKKFIISKSLFACIALFSASLFATANPLFFSYTALIAIDNDAIYFFDDTGSLVGREDLDGAAGMVYDYVPYGSNEWEETGYFTTENDWTLYYNESGEYLGKAHTDAYVVRDFMGDPQIEVIITYVDHKNRPVATYKGRQINSTLNTLLDANPLATLKNLFANRQSTRRIVLNLQGKVRVYDDWFADYDY